MTYATQAAKLGRIPVQVVELDMDACANVYGTAPCTAAIGTTGSQKCFNTYGTCQDRTHYVATTKTYSFCTANAALPPGISGLPLLDSVSFAAQQLTPGKGLGVRSSVTVKFHDMPHHDAGIDPYVKERLYVPENQGTFWGKFRARNKYYVASFMRVKTGYIGNPFSWADFTTREYVINSFEGPHADGSVSITGKDIIRLADDNTSMCPVANSGTLAANITNSVMSCTLQPTGVGDKEYPTGAFRVVISGEGMDCTRTSGSDTLTFTTRDVWSLGALAHKAGDSVQVVKRYITANIQDVIYDLLVNYAGVPASYINKADWDAEQAAYLPGAWSTDICDPTGINTLLSELTQQGNCNIWCDEAAQKIRFQAMRPQSSSIPTLTDEAHFLDQTVTVKDDPTQRISRVLVYYGRINPTKTLDQLDNYAGRYIEANLEAESSREYGLQAITTIYSRWFQVGSLGRIEALTQTLLNRFGDSPRILNYNVDASNAQNLADLFFASTRCAQDETGAREFLNMMVTQIEESIPGTLYKCVAQENVFYGTPDNSVSNPPLVLGGDINNLNLYDWYIQQNGAGSLNTAKVIKATIPSGFTVGSTSTSQPAFVIDNRFPAGTTILLINNGTIAGCGGKGGNATVSTSSGSAASGAIGGPAISISFACSIDNTSGIIGGGGGGGGGGAYIGSGSPVRIDSLGGGGGAGRNAGAGGTSNQSTPGNAGALTVGGNGAVSPVVSSWKAGNGGGLGVAGQAASGTGGSGTWHGSGGAPGAAVVGNSNVTWVASGDIRGALT